MTFQIPATELKGMRRWLRERIDEIPSKISTLTVSKYIEGKRILPQGTPRPGAWSNSYTPYLVEIMDCMSVRSPVSRVIMAKAAQIGATAAAENILGYYMDEVPAAILMMSATGALLDKWQRKRLDPLIDSIGFRHKIGAQYGGPKSRRSGDTATAKEFPGGFLELSSAQSAGSMRSDSIRVLLRDEIDGAKENLDSGEGQWLQVSLARTSAFGDKAKIFDFSTPTTEEESVIWPEYESGDQRKYFVPCPLCGVMQPLEWDTGEKGGMRWKLDKSGSLERVWYECCECEGEIEEHRKGWLLARGEWRATSASYDPTVRSYHISALYSPPGMKSWTRIVSEFLRVQDDPDGLRAFVNLNLGLPYKETGTRPRVEIVESLKSGYKSGTIPSDDILFLTMACDVQRGRRNDEKNPPRIELEVCAHGAGFRTWSIAYHRIEGEIGDPFDGAYEKLNQMALDGKFLYKRDDGMEFAPVATVIDSGDGEYTDVVYAFSSRWNNTYPLKGFGNLKKRQGEKELGDEFTNANFKKYRLARIGDIDLLEVSGNFYKRLIYNSIKIPYQHTGEQRPGFCFFPGDYPREYFKMLTAEELRSDGGFYHGGRRNEALDCRVYGLAARDFWLDTRVQALRESYRGKGYTKAQVLKINTKHVLEMLRQRTARRGGAAANG